MTRKKRSDRNHAIYKITNNITGETYVGITAITGRAIHRSLKVRFGKHISRAKCEIEKDWGLYRNMRLHGSENFSISLIEVVRGTKEAHEKEYQLIHSGQFTLNTHGNK